MIYIAITMVENMNIVPNFVEACALSGSDTVAPYHGIRKLTFVKKNMGRSTVKGSLLRLVYQIISHRHQ